MTTIAVLLTPEQHAALLAAIKYVGETPGSWLTETVDKGSLHLHLYGLTASAYDLATDIGLFREPIPGTYGEWYGYNRDRSITVEHH